MSEARKVSLFRNGRNKALRIPVEFEPPGDEVMIRKEGDLLIVEPIKPKKTLLEFLDSLEPLGPEDQFPDIDDDHLPQREIDL